MPNQDIFRKERTVKQLRKLLQNNENWWLEKLADRMNTNKSNLSRFLKGLNIIYKRKEGCKKLFTAKRDLSDKERIILCRARAMRYAIALRKRGYSYSEIENIVFNKHNIRFDSAVLSRYLKNILISDNGRERLKAKVSKDRSKAGKLSILNQRKTGIIGKAAKRNIKLAIQSNIKRLPKSSRELTPEKAKIISHCLFDGSVTKSKNYKVVSYCSNIKKQVEEFCNLMKQVYGMKSKIYFKEKRIYTVRFCSKELVKDLLKYTQSYSTRANTLAKIPKEILNANKQIKQVFLRAFWDDEGAILVSHRLDKRGYFHPKQKLEAFCTNTEVLADLLQLHSDVGVTANIKRNRIEISGRENLKSFKENIGFSDYIVVTHEKSIWYNIPKNFVLDYALFYYNHKLKAYIRTFGCCANKSDSAEIEGYLIKMGIITVDSEKKADIIVVNSCGVKTPTELKVLNYVNKLAKNKQIILAGCLVNILPDIRQKTPQVRVFFGANQTHLVVPAVISSLFPTFKLNPKLHIKPRCRLHLTYKDKIARIKISQGCLGNCSFCCTKFAQGNLKSKPIDDIINEIKRAVKEGCSRIYLTCQDSGCYGLDIGTNLVELLRKVIEVNGKFKVRVGMMNPQWALKFLDELIEIYKHPKIQKFLHIPVQSGSDKVLKLMNRQYKVADFKEVVKRFRAEVPNINISTDIIVGFPGETEQDFKQTINLLEWLKPEVLNITKFWPRPGIVASKIKQISGAEIKLRSLELTKRFNQAKISR